VDLSKWFVEQDDRGSHELPYGLDYITVFGMDFNGDWSSVVNFLSRRVAVSRWVASLRVKCGCSSLLIDGCPRVPQEVVETIKRTVGVFGIMDKFKSGV